MSFLPRIKYGVNSSRNPGFSVKTGMTIQDILKRGLDGPAPFFVSLTEEENKNG
jgi:hypothetical protein